MPKTDLYGGAGGNPFDDHQSLGSLGKIQEITVYSGDWIDAIEVSYVGRSTNEIVKHGGSGGNKHRFVLDPDEYITKIELGYFPDKSGSSEKGSGIVLNRLKFFTDKDDRESPVFGKGVAKELVELPDGGLLTSFFGRSGDYLDAIGFEHEPDPVEYVELVELHFPEGKTGGAPAKPEVIADLIATNKGNTTERASMTVKKSIAHKVSHSFTKGFKEGLSVKFSGKAKLFNWEVGVTFEANQTISDGDETAISEDITANLMSTVPANSERHGSLIVDRDEFNVPYTGVGLAHHRSGKTVREEIEGIFRGVVVATVREEWDEAKPLSGRTPINAIHLRADGEHKVT
ncbi:MAG: jacalin-like lectin [Pseudomonadota bacterium]